MQMNRTNRTDHATGFVTTSKQKELDKKDLSNAKRLGEGSYAFPNPYNRALAILTYALIALAVLRFILVCIH